MVSGLETVVTGMQNRFILTDLNETEFVRAENLSSKQNRPRRCFLKKSPPPHTRPDLSPRAGVGNLSRAVSTTVINLTTEDDDLSEFLQDGDKFPKQIRYERNRGNGWS